LSLKNFTDGIAAAKVSFSRIGIHTIEALTSASGYFLKTFSCTARAPLSRHKGHVGESKAKKRIFSRSLLNRSLSVSREFSSLIIFVDWLSFLIPKTFSPSTFQLITPNELLPFNLSTTWRTSPKHHFPLGFLVAHWQFPNFFSFWIFSIIVDLSFSK
jgi:hypothetical protein